MNDVSGYKLGNMMRLVFPTNTWAVRMMVRLTGAQGIFEEKLFITRAWPDTITQYAIEDAQDAGYETLTILEAKRIA